MDNYSKEYTFWWIIENYSYSWHKYEEALVSPEFTADDLEGTVWSLQLYPRGEKNGVAGCISLYLKRSHNDSGPRNYSLEYELSILAADGSSVFTAEGEDVFTMGYMWGSDSVLEMDDVFERGKNEYLPQNNLSVRCKIWKGKGSIKPIAQISARTRIEIEEISFLFIIDNFSKVKTDEKKPIQTRSPSKKGLTFSSSLYFTDCSCCEESIVVEFTTSTSNQILSRCKFFLLDTSGKIIPCGEADNRFDATRKDIHRLPLTFTRNHILERKSKYLPKDKLSVLCQCVFSTGVEYKNIERTLYEIPSVTLNQLNDRDRNKDMYHVTERLTACSSALDDFQAIYNNQLLTDMQLKTKTKSFPTHKIVLCARSSVFKAMLTNDMKEKNTNCIQVDDLDDGTVHQLLLFLYSDQFENLEWEIVVKLYYAADKYEVEKLKLLCSSYLLDNVSTSKASELLLLADTHNDSDLKKCVEDFILEHDEQVFGSDEWGNMLETNPLLASKTMRLKYKRKYRSWNFFLQKPKM